MVILHEEWQNMRDQMDLMKEQLRGKRRDDKDGN
jgi:hypothetical protein